MLVGKAVLTVGLLNNCTILTLLKNYYENQLKLLLQ
jgi:hypothetical protein